MKHAPTPATAPLPFNLRDVLKLAGGALASSLPSIAAAEAPAAKARRAKRVIVAGGGIGGLCCAFELMERGYDVTVLEASGRPGGHVRTVHDPLPDGLYADVGAEHFTKPGKVLAAHPRAGRPHPLRRLPRRQPPLGHGRRYALRQPCRPTHPQSLMAFARAEWC
jgi:glycine/D-amino acid oxidase-like deaminating enzyme